jgi:hypothetical protein
LERRSQGETDKEECGSGGGGGDGNKAAILFFFFGNELLARLGCQDKPTDFDFTISQYFPTDTMAHPCNSGA